MPPDPSAIELRLQSLANWALAGLVIIIVFVLAGTSFMLWQAYKIGQQGAQLQAVAIETHASLCALKQELRVRKESTERLIAANPDGIPGIPRPVLDQTLVNYETTLQTLGILSCSSP